MARFIWTEKLLFKAAQAHKSKSEFKSAFPSGYAAARRMGILEVICDHMNAKIKPSGYWKDLNNLKREARKYKTRTDFAHNSQGAYSIAKRLGVLDDICEHMILREIVITERFTFLSSRTNPLMSAFLMILRNEKYPTSKGAALWGELLRSVNSGSNN